VKLALVPEFGSSCLLPLCFRYVRVADLILLGQPFGALRAAELGLERISQMPQQDNAAAEMEHPEKVLRMRPVEEISHCRSATTIYGTQHSTEHNAEHNNCRMRDTEPDSEATRPTVSI